MGKASERDRDRDRDRERHVERLPLVASVGTEGLAMVRSGGAGRRERVHGIGRVGGSLAAGGEAEGPMLCHHRCDRSGFALDFSSVQGPRLLHVSVPLGM